MVITSDKPQTNKKKHLWGGKKPKKEDSENKIEKEKK